MTAIEDIDHDDAVGLRWVGRRTGGAHPMLGTVPPLRTPTGARTCPAWTAPSGAVQRASTHTFGTLEKGVRSTARDCLLRQHGADQMVRGLLSVQSAQLQVIYRAADHGRADPEPPSAAGSSTANRSTASIRSAGLPQRVAAARAPAIGCTAPSELPGLRALVLLIAVTSSRASGRRGKTVRGGLSSACRPPTMPAQGHAGPATGTLVRSSAAKVPVQREALAMTGRLARAATKIHTGTAARPRSARDRIPPREGLARPAGRMHTYGTPHETGGPVRLREWQWSQPCIMRASGRSPRTLTTY